LIAYVLFLFLFTICIDFLTSEPCDWTITNYLYKLITHDPAITRRNAFNRLINDATIIKKHVIAGTIAETMASTLASSSQVSTLFFQFITITVINQFVQSSRGKETFNSFFVSHAAQMSQETLRYGVKKVV
jgi:hypothetical protein